MENKEIETKLIAMVQDILENDQAQIDPEGSLILDYGLDSLDLIEFSFNVEEIFGVRIGTNELKGRAKGRMAEDEMLNDNGNLSAKALKALKESIPEIPPDKIRAGLRQEDIPSLLNIKVFTRIVSEQLQRQ